MPGWSDIWNPQQHDSYLKCCDVWFLSLAGPEVPWLAFPLPWPRGFSPDLGFAICKTVVRVGLTEKVTFIQGLKSMRE